MRRGVVNGVSYRRLFTIILLAAALSMASEVEAKPRYGVVTQDHLGQRDFERMQRGGVDTLRFLLRWSWVEPSPGQYDWKATDAVVAAASRHGIEPLPVIYGSPRWVASSENRPPLRSQADRRAWARFTGELVERYGPDGSVWEGRPVRQPVRRWQIWNEPNFDVYWHPPQSARRFAQLLDLAAEEIRARDPNAKIVLGGVAAVRNGVPWWDFLEDLYRVSGAARDFDAVALHPYSAGMGTLKRQVALARDIMGDAGDARTPLAITEIGWASDGDPRAPLVVGARGQARKLRQAFAMLSAHRAWRISDVHWYAWQDTRPVEAFCSFCEYAGLFDFERRPKPAWRAFRRAAR